MPMYNLIEYSANYSHTSRSLLQFKRNEVPGDNNLSISNPKWFKYNAALAGKAVTDINNTNSSVKNKNSWSITIFQ